MTAVESALVAPMLPLLVFGIIEYGLWLSAPWRPGRASARWPGQDAVGNFGETTSCDLTGATGATGDAG